MQLFGLFICRPILDSLSEACDYFISIMLPFAEIISSCYYDWYFFSSIFFISFSRSFPTFFTDSKTSYFVDCTSAISVSSFSLIYLFFSNAATTVCRIVLYTFLWLSATWGITFFLKSSSTSWKSWSRIKVSFDLSDSTDDRYVNFFIFSGFFSSTLTGVWLFGGFSALLRKLSTYLFDKA